MFKRQASRHLVAMTAISASSLFAGGVLAQGGPPIVINEIRIDQPGTDTDEYFELEGPPGSALDAMAYVVIGDGPAALGSGVVEAVIDLTGQVIPADGHFLVAESTFSLPGVPDLLINLPFENSDNVTHLLVRTMTGIVGDDLDFNDDGVLDVIPWSFELDRIALVEEPNPPANTEYHYGPPSIGPDGTFVPGHAYRCEPDGTWVIGPFDPVGGEDTPGTLNLPCPPPVTFFDGLPNIAIGQATLEPLGKDLIVANIGSSGKDGVSIDLGPRSRGFGFVTFVGEPGNLPSGLKIWMDLYAAGAPGEAGQDQKSLCVFLSEMNDGQAGIGFDTTLLLPTQVRLEFMLEGQPIGTFLYDPPYPTHFISGPIGSTAGCQCFDICTIELHGENPLTAATSAFEVGFPQAPIVPAGKTIPIIADAVRFSLIDAAPMPDTGRAEVRAAIPVGAEYSLTIGREALGLFGNAHVGEGMAHQTTDKNGHLIVSNIGSSGKDGVSIDLLPPPGMPPPQGAEFLLTIPKPVLPNSSLVASARETSGSPIYQSLQANNIDNGVFLLQVAPNFSPLAGTTYTLRLLLLGELVFEQSGLIDPVDVLDQSTAGMQSMTVLPGEYRVGFATPQNISIPGGPTILADEAQFMSDTPGAAGGPASSELGTVVVLCSSLPTVIINDEVGIFPPPPCPADLTGDGVVNAADLAQLLGAWGPTVPCPPTVPEDIDNDCDVDAADLATLLGAWAPC